MQRSITKEQAKDLVKLGKKSKGNIKIVNIKKK